MRPAIRSWPPIQRIAAMPEKDKEDDDPAHPAAKPDPPQRRLETFIDSGLEREAIMPCRPKA